ASGPIYTSSLLSADLLSPTRQGCAFLPFTFEISHAPKPSSSMVPQHHSAHVSNPLHRLNIHSALTCLGPTLTLRPNLRHTHTHTHAHNPPSELNFPKHFSSDLRHLIERLLDPNPLFRAGAGREGAAEIKSHPWFASFDWARFQAKQLPAPYIPKQPSHPGDTCNFVPLQVGVLRPAGDKRMHGSTSLPFPSRDFSRPAISLVSRLKLPPLNCQLPRFHFSRPISSSACHAVVRVSCLQAAYGLNGRCAQVYVYVCVFRPFPISQFPPPNQVDTKQFRNKAYKSKGTFKDF
ncbi:hypothetical protein Vretifemale_4788, partial [Volvox reticuliferus]